MKTKSKLLLALSALTVGTVAAGTTATFAWFTTNRTATAHLTNITAANPNGNLELAITAIHAKMQPATDSNKTEITRSFTQTLRDLSSKEGYEFYAPVWDASSSSKFTDGAMNIPQAYEKYDVWDESDTTKQGYIQFTISITNVGSSALDVYLDPSITSIAGATVTGTGADSSLTSEQQATQAANNALASFMRVGISSLESNKGAVPTSYGGDAKPELNENGNLVFMDSQNNYNKFVTGEGTVTAADTNIGTYTGDDHFFYDVNGATGAGGLDALTTISGQSTNSDRIDHPNYLGRAEADGSEDGKNVIYVTVAIWMEGTCANSDAADGGVVDIDLGFTALDPVVEGA